MKKKGISLIEILLICFILMLLITSMRSYLKMENKYEIEAQGCINYTYGELGKHFNYAQTGRGIQIDKDTFLYPDEYNIKVDDTNELISLEYNGSGDVQEIEFNGVGIDYKNKCFHHQYYIDLNGLTGTLAPTTYVDRVDMSKLFKGDVNTPPILINDDIGAFTGEISFSFCKNDSGDCKILSKFIIDRRVQRLEHKKCRGWKNGGTECRVWTQ